MKVRVTKPVMFKSRHVEPGRVIEVSVEEAAELAPYSEVVVDEVVKGSKSGPSDPKTDADKAPESKAKKAKEPENDPKTDADKAPTGGKTEGAE